VRLFVERNGFEVTSNAAVVTQVLYQLDSLPLPIELAAARVKTLPVVSTRVATADCGAGRAPICSSGSGVLTHTLDRMALIGAKG